MKHVAPTLTLFALLALTVAGAWPLTETASCSGIRVGGKYEGIRRLDRHRTIAHLYPTCAEALASYR